HWLRGSTHVHAAPSGDATMAPLGVMAWYRAHGYDFIVLTDHNRVTIVDPAFAPAGGRTSAAPADGPLVIAGTELTYNPGACTDPAPPPPPDGKCRIHVNGLGVTTRPEGRIEWADRARRDRLGMYEAALRYLAGTGAVIQINHPQWSWGMTPELLTALARDGAGLVEIANVAFSSWNEGDATHPSTEALWDQALLAGAHLWGVASDDAHSYDDHGRYPAGGGWIMVDAPRDADAIVAAIRAGRFYASTGVALAWAGPVGGELVVEAAPDEPGPLTIEVIADGRVVSTIAGRRATYPLPAAPHYVRARVTRADGARAWTQPASAAAVE
ncbi:MAG TPA: CehA/McbA family metallohydrolase, partial [Kofleriaceae bacterium]|nr:CehA/McbA family metallohydrolase [Kofleriaceae bacterium]